MRKLLLLVLVSMPAWGQSALFYTFPVPLPGATFRVCNVGTQNPCPSPVSIFADQALTQPIPQPAQTGPTGQFGFWVPGGQYTIQIGQPYNFVYIVNLGGGGLGGGTVTSFNAGSLNPLFTTNVGTPTVTPSLTFTLTSVAADSVFGNCTGLLAQPAYCPINSGMLPFTYTGNTTKLVTSTGALSTGHCVQIDASGNYVDAGGICNSGVTPIALASLQAGASSDVRISNAIASLSGGNGIVWANDSTSQSWSACPSFGAGTVHLVLFPVTYSVAVNCTIPANVTVDHMRGAILAPANATTTTILGPLIAERAQIFSNALAGQGTISFTNSTKTPTLYPQWFGAKVDGSTNDLPALQAVTDVAGAATASTPGPGTIDLGCGVYALTGTWTIATSNGQHHVNIAGQNPLCTTINSTVAAFPATAIYLSKEKFATLSGFFLHSTTLHQGVGITMGGLTGSGTQTNGSTLENIIVDGFDTGILTTDSVLLSTSSEIVFSQIVLQNNNTGFINTSFNGLNYVFNLLSTANNTIGVDMETPGITVNGGDSSSNGTDFKFSSGLGPGNTVIDFRSETAVTQCVNMPGDTGVTLIGYACQGLSTPTSHTAITQASGNLTIQNGYIAGQILETAGGNLTLSNVQIMDPNNTYSITNQAANMGPGFRLNNPGNGTCGATLQDCGHFDVRNILVIDASNAPVSRVPSMSGWYTGGSASSIAIPTNIGQGAALTVSGNAIAVTAYMHHVGAGLIKNITLPTNANFPNMGTVNWEMPCIQLIPDAAFTTDATGNISKASTAVIGQPMTMCLDPNGGGAGVAKWYPSY